MRTHQNKGERIGFEELPFSLQAVPRIPRAMVAETRRVIEIARRFNQEMVAPYALELERRTYEEPDYLPWDFVKKANEVGFYSMWIPRLFGGRGYNMPSLAFFLEEISTSCLAMANLIGVHYLGVGALSASWNVRQMNRLCRLVAAGEKSGEPCLISLANTEPSAGTDLEDVDLMDKGQAGCVARRVDGGYLVNGRKVFISNGHLSTWHILIAFTDLKKASESTVMLAVKTGMNGFSFGRVEKKMGQRACPASELVFEDCFVPDNNVCIDASRDFRTPTERRAITNQVIEYVVSTSRAGVCAFGTGAARGAFEKALAFAANTRVKQQRLIDCEWAQLLLAEMYKNVEISRLAYAESNYANSLHGLFKYMVKKPFYYWLKFAPRFVMDRVVGPLMERPFTTRIARAVYFARQKKIDRHRTSGWGSLAKVVGSDLGIKNCQLALQMMGQTGVRHDAGIEKILRDVKLLQIYEGTNQLNALNLFKCLIAERIPSVRMFSQ